jgi:hypothetical protein
MMLTPIDPNRDLKLCLGLAASGALAITPLALPANALTRSIFPIASVTGSIAAIAKVNTYEHQDKQNQDAKERWDALKQDMDDSLLISSQAFYTANPQAWLQRREVPHQWHEQYLNARFSPLPELPQPQFETVAQPQTQPQAQPIQQPGQVRGGSFDRAGAGDSSGSGWGDYEPRPVPPIAQTPIAHQSFTLQSEPDDAWLDRLVAPSVLLVFGGDGSGKTSMALELLRRRQRAGHQVIALDPHAHPAKWPGCEVIGGGLNFGQIEAAIGQLQRLREQRYEQIRSGAIEPCKFPPITFVMEELTDWKSEVSNVDLLILKAGDYRKANIHLLMVTHGDSMSQIGAPTGSNEIIKNCVTKLRLFSKPGADGKPIPAFKGELAYPLQAPIAVSVPRFTTTAQTPPTQAPEALSMTSFEPSPPPMLHASESPASRPEAPKIAPSQQPEASSDREAELLAQFSEMKAMGMNKKQICYAIWGAKMGGTDRYRMASEFYDRLNSKYSELSGDNAA